MYKFIASLGLAVSLLCASCATQDISKVEPYVRLTASTLTSGFLIASHNAASDAAVMNRIATQVASLTSGPVITPEQFQAAILQVVPKNDTRYIALVGSLTGLYAQFSPLIHTDYSQYLKLLNDLSNGVKDATAGYDGVNNIRTDKMTIYASAAKPNRTWFVEQAMALSKDEVREAVQGL